MTSWLPEIGKTYEREWPFLREKVELVYWDIVDPSEDYETWKPGFEMEQQAPYGDSWPVAHGMGAELFTVVSTHKPGPKYPTRVFYIRQWRDPDGKVFGQRSLRQCVAWAFRKKLETPQHLWELEIVEARDD